MLLHKAEKAYSFKLPDLAIFLLYCRYSTVQTRAIPIVDIMSAQNISPPLVLSASAILPALCIVAVGLRFYTRRIQHQNLRLDDWLTVPALVNTRLPKPEFKFIAQYVFDRSSHWGLGLLSSLVSTLA